MCIRDRRIAVHGIITGQLGNDGTCRQQISHNSKGQRGTLSPEHLEIDHLPVQGSGYGGLDFDLTHGQVPPWWIWDSLLLVDCLHTLGVGEDALTDTQILGSYFQQLVLADELHALLQACLLYTSRCV